MKVRNVGEIKRVDKGVDLINRAYKLGIFDRNTAKELMEKNLRGEGIYIPETLLSEGTPEDINEYAKNVKQKAFFLVEVS